MFATFARAAAAARLLPRILSGTLFAFVLVCGGVLMLPSQKGTPEGEPTKGRFRLPYINAKYIFPGIIISTFTFLIIQFPAFFTETILLKGENYVQSIPMICFFVICLDSFSYHA